MRIIKNRRARLMVVAMLIAVGSSATAWSNVGLGATIEAAITSSVSTEGVDARAEQVVEQVVEERASEVAQRTKEEKRGGTTNKVAIVIAIVLAALATILIVFGLFSRHNGRGAKRTKAGGAINGEEVAAIATALSLYKAEMNGGGSRDRGGRGRGSGRSARGGSEWNSKLLNMRKIPDKGRGWNP